MCGHTPLKENGNTQLSINVCICRSNNRGIVQHSVLRRCLRNIYKINVSDADDVFLCISHCSVYLKIMMTMESKFRREDNPIVDEESR